MSAVPAENEQHLFSPSQHQFKETLKNYHVLYVGVTTPLEVLEAREQARGDRCLGSARGQYFKVHENVEYDIEIRYPFSFPRRKRRENQKCFK